MSTSSTSRGGGSGGVMVVGSANQDLTSYTPLVPTLGETVMGSAFETSCGGKGANQACAAASLMTGTNDDGGGVTMVCRVGNDVFGHNLLDNFQRLGVSWDETCTMLKGNDRNKDNENSNKEESKTSATLSSGVATIVVDEPSGDNCIIVTPGANYALTPEEVRTSMKKHWSDKSKSPPKVVIVQLEIQYEAALEALKTAKELFGPTGVITILNPAPAPTDPSVLEDFYPFVDIIIPNETELATLCGQSSGSNTNDKCNDDNNNENNDSKDEEAMAQMLFDKGVGQAVVVTLGARGAMVVSRQIGEDSSASANTSPSTTSDTTVTYVDAPADLPARNDPIVDTIGAGDAFCGALSSYLAAGLELEEGAGKACGFASMSVRRRGASYPRAHELPETLRLPLLAKEKAASTKSDSAASAAKPTITFVTGNPNKVKEIEAILSSKGELPFKIVHQKVENLPEVQGEADEIARTKCRMAAKDVGGACFTEDTSLSFNALHGLPGPYIASFLQKLGHDGLNKMLQGFDDKSAVASTRIAFTAGPGGDVHLFEGSTHGSIVSARGSTSFGWDAIFQPDRESQSDASEAALEDRTGYALTYGEMSAKAKNTISHRSKSLAKFQAFLLNEADGIQKAMEAAGT